MPRLHRKLKLVDSPERGFCLIQYPFSHDVNNALKDFPGIRFAKEHNKNWTGPNELTDEYKAIAEKFSHIFEDHRTLPEAADPTKIHPKARSHQLRAVMRGLIDRSLFVRFDPGFGKSFTAIELTRQIDLRGELDRALFVAPAGVVNTWVEEFDEWWPDHPEIGVVKTGKDIPETPILIVSYEMSWKVPLRPWSLIVLDESPYIANQKLRGGARRARIATELGLANSTAYRVCLSGMPIPTEIDQIRGQINWLWPGNGKVGRLGTPWQFENSYMGKRPNPRRKRGWDPVGINDARKDELFKRLSSMMVTLTEEETKKYIEAPETKLLYLPKPRMNLNKMLNSLDYYGIVEAHGDAKVKEVAELAALSLQRVPQCMILTHLRNTAAAVTKQLTRMNVQCVHVDGSVPNTKRQKILKMAVKEKNMVIVSTMHAVEKGLNMLANVQEVFFVEYHWSPGVLVQASRRVSRMNSKQRATLNFLLFRGSYEESVVQTARRRLNEADSAYGLGGSEEVIRSGLTQEQSEDEQRTFLSQIAAGMVDEEDDWEESA